MICLFSFDYFTGLWLFLFSQQEETRQKLVISDNKVRQLEAQTYEEQLASASERKVCMGPAAYIDRHISFKIFAIS